MKTVPTKKMSVEWSISHRSQRPTRRETPAVIFIVTRRFLRQSKLLLRSRRQELKSLGPRNFSRNE